MLTQRQFAFAAGATEKWVHNASRILGRRFERTENEARWLGLVREIAQSFDMSLGRAGDITRRALDLDPATGATAVASSGHGDVRIVVDMRRYHSRFGVALAAALLLEAHRHRGPRPPRFPRGARTRPAILVDAAATGVDVARLRALAFASPAERVEPLGEGIQAILRDVASVCVPHVVVGDVAAVARGVPREQALLEVCYRLVGGNATPVARLLALWNARSRGVEGAYPFIPDDQTVGESRVLALETRHGPVVLRRCIEPGPEFAKLVAWSDTLDLGSVQVPVVRVAALVAALREIRLPVPATAIAELEATAVVRNRVDLGP